MTLEVNDCKEDQTEVKRHLVSKAALQLLATRRMCWFSTTGGLPKPFKERFFLFLDETIFLFQGLHAYHFCTEFSLDLLRSQVAENNSNKIKS